MLSGDHLVIALGAVSRPDVVRGLSEHGHDVWDFAGVAAATDALARFGGGRLVILVAGAPYPCPPAPYECALHLDEYLRERGLRDRTDLSVTTLQPMLMPNAGHAGSDWMAEQLAARDITYRVGAKIETVDAGRLNFANGSEQPFDLLIAVLRIASPTSSPRAASPGQTAGSRSIPEHSQPRMCGFTRSATSP
jgi:sulfide:quinone oxidoreductase